MRVPLTVRSGSISGGSIRLENGEFIEIIKRGRRFARLLPAAAASPEVSTKVDFAAQLRVVWGNKVFSNSEIEAIREAEPSSQS